MHKPDAIATLERSLHAIADLESTAAILEWDMSTNLPDAAGEVRGRQLALIAELAHARFTSDELRDTLDACRAFEDADSAHGALVRRTRQKVERARRVPQALVREIKQHSAATYVAWTTARPANDFASVRPLLERSVELSRRLSACHPGAEHVLDPLIEESDRGMTTAQVETLFTALREALVPLARAIAAAPAPDVSFLSRHVPAETQLAFGKTVAEAIGFDFRRGRQDQSPHPFMTRLGGDDIRITTRVKENELTEALFSTVHEVGHALYELQIDPAFDGTPLGGGTSAGVHESQSRLWENIVGRSEGFWQHFLPKLKAAMPGIFDDVSLDAWVRAINVVTPSLIRTEADEVTYNLHVMLRFDLEKALLEGTLAVRDLPEAWNERMARDLGVRPKADGEGVLQDIHWYCTTIGGAFQGYTLGNMMSAQFYDAARRHIGDLDGHIARGELAPLREFLRENIHRHGAVYDPAELVERATGKPLGIESFVGYLTEKYSELYGLSLDAIRG
jgi:carboxypeptidase Taq